MAETKIPISGPTNNGEAAFGVTVAALGTQLAHSSKGGTVAVADDVLVIPVTHTHVSKETGADAEALTLADGKPGQILVISLDTDGGGDGTLTPATSTGWATCVFADAGDTLALLFVNTTVGWVILGTAGVLAPPVISV